MSINERAPVRKRFRLTMPGEIMLLAAVAGGFLLLHVLAGTLRLPGGSSAMTPQEQASLSSAD